MGERVIIVPKDKIAEDALIYDKAKKGQLLEFVLNEAEFYLLFNQGIFHLISEIGDAIIDDFEDASIVDSEKILQVIHALKIKEESNIKDIKLKISEIRKIFEEALKRGTGVYFYF